MEAHLLERCGREVLVLHLDLLEDQGIDGLESEELAKMRQAHLQ